MTLIHSTIAEATRADFVVRSPSRKRLKWWSVLVWPGWARRRQTLVIELWVAVGLVYALTAAAYVWPIDLKATDPLSSLIFAGSVVLRTFIDYLGWPTLGLGVMAWWLKRRRLALLTIPLLGWMWGPTLGSYHPRATPAVAGETLRVTTFNLLLENEEVMAVLNELKRLDPDVLCLQEYTQTWHDAVHSTLDDRYPYHLTQTDDNGFGMALYSRKPFLSEPIRELGLGSLPSAQMRVVISLAGRDVVFYAIHFVPPINLWFIDESRAQLADLLDRLNAETLPTLVAGDFNFTERSRQAAALRHVGFQDAYSIARPGRGGTWNRLGHDGAGPPSTQDGAWTRFSQSGAWIRPASLLRRLLTFRLDHVYLKGGLTCRQANVGQGSGSDHRPLTVELGFEAP